MDFEHIVISPDNYRFLNFFPIVINLYFEIRKCKNRLELSFNACMPTHSSTEIQSFDQLTSVDYVVDIIH